MDIKFYKIKMPAKLSYTTYRWLEDNCTGKFYTGFDWNTTEIGGKENRIVEFENEKDATLFALRWS